MNMMMGKFQAREYPFIDKELALLKPTEANWKSKYKVEERADKWVIFHPRERSSQTEVTNPAKRHRFTLIWLHGLNGSAYDFKDVFTDEKINSLPRNCKIVLPTLFTCGYG